MMGLRLGLSVLLTLLVQLALVNRLSIAGIRPDLTVLLVFLMAVRLGPTMGTLLGFVLGLLQDLLVPSTFGMGMLAKTLLGYGVGRLARTLVIDAIVMQAALIGIAVLAHDTVYLLAYTRLQLPRFFVMFVSQSIPTALYTAATGAVVLVLASSLTPGATPGGRRESGRGW